MTLRELLDEAATADPEIERLPAEGGDVVEWRVGGRTFAVVEAGRASFRLSPPIRRAALNTPDTAPSSRGPEWLDFVPPELDRMAVDRAAAWFGSAARHAAEPR